MVQKIENKKKLNKQTKIKEHKEIKIENKKRYLVGFILSKVSCSTSALIFCPLHKDYTIYIILIFFLFFFLIFHCKLSSTNK